VGRHLFAFVWGAAVVAVLCLSWAEENLAQEPVAPDTKPLEGGSDMIDEGRSLFNQYCAHCHGPNAIQGERPRDLRRLALRYGQRAPEVFWQSVTNGRLDKGMPVWKGTLSDDMLRRILTYLQTVQSPP
jgi:polar amino acid transport system substrate-binding protein